ncbi:MAG TPA: hypothetical protein VMH83_05010, partial [Candidatus Acidoferrum sp.]|nr:hypothetical protein [Candidatus Acidoferrum sp.]
MVRRMTLFVVVLWIAGCGDSSKPGATKQDKTSDTMVVYDPTTCKTDSQGMVYFALGHEVFRMPYKELRSVRGMPPEERAELPPRPDPGEPEGCPGNPLWGGNFGISYVHKPAHPENYPPETSFQTGLIEIIQIPER